MQTPNGGTGGNGQNNLEGSAQGNGAAKLRAFLYNNRVWILIAAALLVLLGIVFISNPTGNVHVSATLSSGDYVSADTAFSLAGVSTTREDTLRSCIEVEPSFRYSLEREGEGNWTLQPRSPLPTGEKITIRVDNTAFVFTVESPLEITYHYPMLNAINVPLRSGIELEFSHLDVDTDVLEEHIAIEPELEYRLSYSAATGRFSLAPLEDMQPGTEYIVTIQSGLSTSSGYGLQEDYEFFFTTEGEREDEDGGDTAASFQLYGSGVSLNVLTDEPPVLEAYFSRTPDEDVVGIELYQFEDGAAYFEELQRLAADRDAKLLVTGLEKVLETEAEVLNAAGEGEDSGSSGIRHAIVLPEPVAEGWYALRLTASFGENRIVRTKLVQASDLSVFYMWVDDDLVCWVNDVATGQPATGAQVTIAGNYAASATTGSDGSAIAAGTLAMDEGDYVYSGRSTVQVQWNGHIFYDTASFYDYNYAYNGRPNEQYMAFLYTDRPVYKRTDTISLWGFVKPRNGTVPALSSITLEYGNLYATNGAETMQVALKADGTFTLELPIEDYGQSYINFGILMDGSYLATTYPYIEDYEKPTTRIVGEGNQPVYIAGEEGTYTLTVENYDGTRLPDYGLAISGTGAAESSQRTDEDGHLTVALDTNSANEDSWSPRYRYVSAQSTDVQGMQLTYSGGVYIIPRDVMLRTNTRKGDNGATIEVSTHKVDISGIQYTTELWDYENLQGAPVDTELTATVTHVWYEKVITGTRYDYINRVSVESYKYEKREEVVDKQTFTTKNGSYTFEGLPAIETGWLKVTFIGKDTEGRRLETSCHVGSSYSYSGWDSSNTLYYSLDPVPSADDVSDNDEDDYYWGYSWYRQRFGDGESTRFALTQNEEPMDALQGRLLYCIVQDGIRDVRITTDSEVMVGFSERLLPNYQITGAYFDGRYVHALNETNMYFDASTRELALDITPDKDTYAPGDTVTLDIHATNAHTGNAAAGASFVVGVVDEAVYAVQEESIWLPSSLYSSVFYYNIHYYTSHQHQEMPNGGEMGGGGGGGELREDFEDTAYFGTVTAGTDGRTRVSFTLPDNITEWRATAIGLTPQNHAGYGTINLQASLGYYVSPVLNEEIVEGDSYAVGLYSAGKGIAADEPVEYYLRLQGLDVDETQRVKSTLRGYALADFGTLAAGEYTITVEGSCGELKDGVRHSFTVSESLLAIPVVETFLLEDGIDIAPLRWPVNVVLYDENAQAYNQVLRGIRSGARGERADARLARRFVAERMEAAGSWYNKSDLTDSISDLNGNSSLLKLLSYDYGSFDLTLQAHIAMPQHVGTGALANYVEWEQLAEDADGDKLLAYAVLYGEVPEGAYVKLENKNEEFTEQMYAVMALHAGGDTKTAAAAFEELVLQSLEKKRGLNNTWQYNIKATSKSKTNEHTAAAAMAATMLGHEEEATALVLYLANTSSRYDLYLLEMIYYLNTFQPGAAQGTAYSFTAGGATINGTTQRYGTQYSFTKAQWESFSVGSVGGTVYADVYYTGTGASLTNAEEAIGLTKTIQPVKGTGLAVGDLVKVTITADYSAFDTKIGYPTLYVEDVLPSGMRFEYFEASGSNVREYNGGWYLSGREGQNLHFTVYSPNRNKASRPIVYYARVVLPGEYVVESAYITSGSAGLYGVTDRDTILLEEA